MAFIVFMTVRMWGQGQTFKPFDSPFFQTVDAPAVIVPWEQNYLLAQHPDLLLWVDIYRGAGEQILVKPWKDRAKDKKTLEQNPNPTRPLLRDLLLQFPKTRFVINCNDNVHDIHFQLVQAIKESQATERVLVQSDYNTILISAKKLAPMALYGSTIADLTRLKAFDSLWILPAAPFEGDVLFAPLKYRNRETINRDIVLEMKRRFKKVYVGPLATQDDLNKARGLGVDGYFVEDPFLILEKSAL